MRLREILAVLGIVAAVAGAIALVPTLPRGSTAKAGPPVNWRTVADDRSKRLTISWMGPPIAPGAREGTWVEKRMEEAFNVDFKPIFLDHPGYQNRKPLMLMAGDVPDVCWDGDPLILRQNIHHGFVMELPYEVIIRHAPTYVRLLNKYGRAAWLYSYFNGRNYGIPTFAASDIYPIAALWRKDWLRNVGIDKVPDTLEEMHEAFRRFRYNDPDRNGKKDTYAFCPEIHWSVTYVEIFCMFNVLPQDFIARGDKVVWGGIQPEAREALAVLRQWYQEDLIDPDYITATFTTNLSQSKFLNGRIGYMPYAGTDDALDLSNDNSTYSRLKQICNENRRKGLTGTDAELVAAPPPIGRDGKRRYRFWGGPAHVIWFGTHVGKQPEKALRVLWMFEELAKRENEKLFVESRIGQEGLHWRWDEQRGVVPLPPYDQPGNDAKHLLGVGLLDNAYGFFSCCSAPLEVTDKYLPRRVKEFRAKYRRTEWGLMNAIGKSDVVESAERYLDDLREYQAEAYAEIIRGEKNLDYFDTFVAEWKRRGGDVLTREANEMFQIMKQIEQIVEIPATQPAGVAGKANGK
ncbi:MAG TPA: hypothetical protein VM098_09005 [Phycisphaerae bacterium]|nr:hypothetical protein [Phycisphaerae bacterium]